MAPVLWLILGFVLLVGGAEILVRGASRLALAVGLSRLVIGLVVVSFGTSAPEIAISTGSAIQGKADLALGNVVGSNVFNVLFILGATTLIAPLMVQARLIRLDIPVMIMVALILGAIALDGTLDLLDGILLLSLSVGYTVMNLRLGRREAEEERQASGPRGEARPSARQAGIAVAFVAVGLVGLVIGARFVVDGASAIARDLGASDLVIGLTIVAAGTGLPETVTSVFAAIRGEREIAVGNIVGSNILNITAVLGLASAFSPDGLAVAQGAITFDIPVMIAVFLALLPVVFTRQIIARWEGALFLVYYVAYVAHLVLTATDHPGADEFGFALLWFALPLTLIVFGAAAAREIRRRLKQRNAG